MIASLRGVVLEKNLNDAVVDVSGVGYRVHLSLLTLARLPDEGEEVRLRIRTVVREEALDLFGFLSRPEEEMFLLLTSVSHVGPKLALNVLSGLELLDLATALAKGEVARLTRIHGVGKKTAERLVLELREKAKLMTLEPASGHKAAAKVPEVAADLVSALVNLGYKTQQAEKAVEQAASGKGADAPFEVLFRETLKVLRTG